MANPKDFLTILISKTPETIEQAMQSDMIEKYLPEERLEIKFTAIDENKRLLKIIPYGQRYEELCEAVL